jgi:DNA-3-methyladenine glycosylase II
MIGSILNTEETIKEAEAQLQKLDPVLGKLIQSQKLIPHPPRTDYFASLCRSIVGQQVSVAAATAIYGRLEQSTGLKPQLVMKLSDEQIKMIGLSKQKTAYIRDLAQHFIDDPGVYAHLEQQDDEQIIAELTNVKGIGRWTAQMFLMFTLARPDIFAPDDIGLQQGMMRLYRWTVLPPKKDLEKAAAQWRPYRTVASWHLWQSLRNTQVK